MRAASSARTNTLQIGISFVLALVMTTCLIPIDDIAYAAAISDNMHAAQPVPSMPASEAEKEPVGVGATTDEESANDAVSDKSDDLTKKGDKANSPSNELLTPTMTSLSIQSDSPEGSREGIAYAVLEYNNANTLTFFRSKSVYSDGNNQTVTDVLGNTYTGQVYTGVEDIGASYTSIPWYSQRGDILFARIADSQVITPKSCAYWFSGCSAMMSFDGAERLDTSAATNMSGMFRYCSNMNEPPSVGSWDTGTVTNMSEMFCGCSLTNPPEVGNWNTGAVTNMSSMFDNCTAMAAPPAVSGWNTSSVTDMSSMFAMCSSMANPPSVGNWDTSTVTNMSNMFGDCYMTEPPAVDDWNTSAVTNMQGMFVNCPNMVEPPAVDNWDTSKVTNMSAMFDYCMSMAKPPSVGNWDTSKVTDMSAMFDSCSELVEPPAVSSWNTSAVTDMQLMFGNCMSMVSLDVSGWDFSNITDSWNYLGLDGCTELKKLTVPAGAKIDCLPEHEAQGSYLATWKNADRRITGSTADSLMSTINAGNGAGTWKWELAGTAYAVLDSAGTLTLFRSASTYTAGTGQTVTDVMGNTYTGQVFTGIETNTGTSSSSARWYSKRTSVKLARIADDQVIAPKSCAGWFYYCSNMTAFEGADRLDTSAVTNMSHMFCGCSAMTEPPAVDNWDTSKVTSMAYMFGYYLPITEPPAVGNWDTSKVTNMTYMFYCCSSMAEPPAVSNWNTSKVTDMSWMFAGCSSIAEPPSVGNWDTSAVTDIRSMFYGCSEMAEPPEVSNWNTSAVAHMYGAFNSCLSMTSLDVSGWDFSTVISWAAYTGSVDYLGLQSCSALRELKVPADARIDGLPEHTAQGDYVETWGNTERGIAGSTASALMSAVNAGNGAGTWTWDLAGYTIDFSVDGSDTAMQAEHIKTDEVYIIPSCEVVRLYHDFTGWNGSDGEIYQEGDTIPAGTFNTGERLTLTAMFEPHEYGPGESDDNLQITVPTSINLVARADGTLIGPNNATIENHSAVDVHISSVDVDEQAPFKIVADAASSSSNSIDMQFGPAADQLNAAGYLAKTDVADPTRWCMTAEGTSGASLGLQVGGHISNITEDITAQSKFGTIKWYLKAVA